MIILIDSNYLGYYHSFKGPLTYNGQQVGIIFGFLQSLLSLAKAFDTNRFVFAWDSRRSLRRIWLPTYKSSRVEGKSTEEKAKRLETFKQFISLRVEVLPQFGFKNIFLKSGYEGDDIIASVCRDNPEEEIEIVRQIMISGNSFLIIILCMILSPRKNTLILVLKRNGVWNQTIGQGSNP